MRSTQITGVWTILMPSTPAPSKSLRMAFGGVGFSHVPLNRDAHATDFIELTLDLINDSLGSE